MVERTDMVDWGQDCAMVVIAQDELHAEKVSRRESEYFKKAKLRVTEINMDEEQVILIENTGG
jgi:hypothetical protein